jgi:hypothetical protein
MQFRPLLHLVATAAMTPSTLLNAATPSFSFSAPQLISLPQEFGYDQVVGVGDLNGDGNTDLLTRGGLLWDDGKGHFKDSGIDESLLYDLSAYPASDFQSYPPPSG